MLKKKKGYEFPFSDQLFNLAVSTAEARSQIFILHTGTYAQNFLQAVTH